MTERNLLGYIIEEEFLGHKNVKILLFRVSWNKAEEAGVNWSELVQDYDQQAKNRQLDLRIAVMELLTGEEIKQLKKWFRTHTQSEVKECTVKFPLPKNQKSLGRKTLIDGLSSFIIYPENYRDDYDLPFEVWGYYDLEGCEKINQRRS